MTAKRTRQSGAGRRKATPPPLPTIAAIDGISIERQVYQALRVALMGGAVRPGEGLTSRSLSEALGVSPTPVREALKRLDADGALVSRSKSAFFVYDPDRVDFTEIFEIRLMLESHAIRRAALRATPEQLAPAVEVNDEYQKILLSDEPSSPHSLQVNFRFHFELYKLSGSAKLVEMIETLWLRVGPTLQRYMPPPEDRSISIFHNQMLDAVAGRDPDMAEDALRKDLTTAYEAIIPLLRDRASAR